MSWNINAQSVEILGLVQLTTAQNQTITYVQDVITKSNPLLLFGEGN